jgi:hypothetical protein
MIRAKVFAALLLAAGLAAPAWGQGTVRHITDRPEIKFPFNAAEAAQLMEVGEANLTGQAYLYERTSLLSAGTKLYAKNQVVHLYPMTAFMKAWVEKFRGKGLIYGRFDLHKELDFYSARVITDEDGRFRFRGLKPGDYLLWTVLPYEKDVQVLQDTGRSQTVTWSSFGIVTAAVREPVFRAANATISLEHNIIRLVNIPAGTPVVDLGGIHGDEKRQ